MKRLQGKWSKKMLLSMFYRKEKKKSLDPLKGKKCTFSLTLKKASA